MRPGFQMQITHELQQVRLAVTQNRFKPSLKQMADLTVFSVEVSNICELQPVHNFRKGNFPGFD